MEISENHSKIIGNSRTSFVVPKGHRGVTGGDCHWASAGASLSERSGAERGWPRIYRCIGPRIYRADGAKRGCGHHPGGCPQPFSVTVCRI